jgi:hypothetical protein
MLGEKEFTGVACYSGVFRWKITHHALAFHKGVVQVMENDKGDPVRIEM